MFDRIRKFFSKDYKERIARAKEGPVIQTGIGPTVKNQKCPNCKIQLNENSKVSVDASFLKIFKYLICSKCGYQKRIKI